MAKKLNVRERMTAAEATNQRMIAIQTKIVGSMNEINVTPGMMLTAEDHEAYDALRKYNEILEKRIVRLQTEILMERKEEGGS